MSKKNWKPNYTNYTKPAITNEEVEKEGGVVYEDTDVETETPVEETISNETPEVQAEEKVYGFVNGTAKLNVRNAPTTESKPVAIIDKNTEVVIHVDSSNDAWYFVEVNGIAGFCMKKYITIK